MVVTVGGGLAAGSPQVEAGSAAGHSTQGSPTMKNYLAPNVRSPEAENPAPWELTWPEEDASKMARHKNRCWVDILAFAKVGEVQISPGC